ncbi:hypothetical protein NQ314_009435, partial [Rhamnusium bicolor]
MGCQFIEGACVRNHIYNLPVEERLWKTPLKRIDPSKGVFCTSDGRAVDTPSSMMAFHVYKQIEHEASSLFNMSNGKEHGSLPNFLGLRIQQELQKFPEDQRYDASRIMVPLGFVGVLSLLMKMLPECALKFGKPVGLIRWGAVQSRNKGPRVVVQCCDGEEYCADYVIMTVSLGVLKKHGEKMFCPALSYNKMDAIRNLGYGTVDKVFLNYESQDKLAHRTDWTKGLNAVDEVEESKHVLCAYISGPEAVVIEHATDEEVAEGITKVLRQFTGDASLPYMNMNSNMGHQCDLNCPVPGACDPVPPILLFAGETACAGYHSTVHVARLSGNREAKRI